MTQRRDKRHRGDRCGAVVVTDTEGVRINEQRCPVCARGVMVQRHSQYGPFFACTNFPACRHKLDPGRVKKQQMGR
jgi:ssDNA-binding Zn-finger/Zn-ribbon topoisomerase 1